MRLTAQYWIEQLAQNLRQTDLVAQRAEASALDAAKHFSTPAEKKDDARAALEFGGLATGQAARARAVQQDLQTLIQFYEGGVPHYGRSSSIGLGAVVDVAMETPRGDEERTFILLPVGAGSELTGPGGDGFLTVITPASPVGRALLGKRAGDYIELVLAGEPVEWTVVEVN